MKSDDRPKNRSAPASKSIVLVSSISGFTESPGLFAYAAAKHGVLGLTRALNPWAPDAYGIRVNAICPWATDTQLITGIKSDWVEAGMPMNSPTDVAKIIAQCLGNDNVHGQTIFVSGGKGVDIEQGLNRTMAQWLGEQNTVNFEKGQIILGMVSHKILVLFAFNIRMQCSAPC
jgi:NAD(P)-dependent dehydrogenase (short-subunit alcohol dehydrogenase family)